MKRFLVSFAKVCAVFETVSFGTAEICWKHYVAAVALWVLAGILFAVFFKERESI